MTNHAADVFVARPPQRRVTLDLTDLWRSRELAWFLTRRNIKVRYKQSLVGIGWAVLQPFFTMVVFSLLFARVGKLPTNGLPAPLFYFAALVPWYFFANTVSQSAASLAGNAAMLQKVYFPRLTLPVAALGATCVDFVIAFGVLLGMMGWYGTWGNGLALAALPPLLLLAGTASLGIGMLLAALNVRYRDVQYATPFLLQIGLLATVAIPANAIAEPWRTVFGLNPMVGVVEGFRWALLGQAAPPVGTTLASVGVTGAAFLAGLVYFRRTEAVFADVV